MRTESTRLTADELLDLDGLVAKLPVLADGEYDLSALTDDEFRRLCELVVKAGEDEDQ